MAIPGYDPADLENAVTFADETAGARVDVVAGRVPEAFDVGTGEGDPPSDAVSARVELTGADELAGVEAVRIALSYDPAAMPAGATPEDVTVVAETDDGRRHLSTALHRESETVSAELSGERPADAFVAVVDER
ncbi:hypothetical protein [Halovivax sp.]|uniref:hypothetical protein n=1 Tax=Halovivax sp. TaxID=1935978 RepID=UPI0025B9B9DB|nr:hypothetical protein [Halovivax sp.]